MASSSDAPHLPRSAPIEAYGKGGFAFADMSHRGSLLCLPHGIWAWPVTRLTEIDEYSLDRVFKAANSIDTLIVGTGTVVINGEGLIATAGAVDTHVHLLSPRVMEAALASGVNFGPAEPLDTPEP